MRKRWLRNFQEGKREIILSLDVEQLKADLQRESRYISTILGQKLHNEWRKGSFCFKPYIFCVILSLSGDKIFKKYISIWNRQLTNLKMLPLVLKSILNRLST